MSIHWSQEKCFLFNPNNLPEKDWLRLGLSAKQIKVIKNYESKGGKFRTKEDVKKMYCISPEEYSLIQSYIQIPQGEADKNFTKDTHSLKAEPIVKMVELNSADTLEFDKLKGIGFSYAKRIIKYRELLGGFVRKEQLMEVYGFDQERYNALSSVVFVDDSKVKKININADVFEELKRHPYIKYNLANLILNYRKQHGNYKSVEDIKQLNLMNDELLSKISPYLTVE